MPIIDFMFPPPPPPPPRKNLIGEYRWVIKVVEYPDPTREGPFNSLFARRPDYMIKITEELEDGKYYGWPYYYQRWRGRRVDNDEVVEIDDHLLDKPTVLEVLASV